MSNFLYKLYAKIFAKSLFYKWNYHLFRFSLNGLGILNYYNSELSGENFFLKNILPNFVSETPVFFDVGANVGDYSKTLSSIFPKSSIHLFEPHPVSYKLIRSNKSLTNVRINNFALSSTVGSTELFDYINKDGSSHASVYKGVIEDIHKSESIAHKILKETIDNYLFLNELTKIDLLKIDVEGHELAVLQGASEAINSSRIKIIHFEFNEMNVESKSFMKDFYSILNDYKFYRMLPKSLLPLPEYRALTHELFAYQNIIAIRKDMVGKTKI